MSPMTTAIAIISFFFDEILEILHSFATDCHGNAATDLFRIGSEIILANSLVYFHF